MSQVWKIGWNLKIFEKIVFEVNYQKKCVCWNWNVFILERIDILMIWLVCITTILNNINRFL